MNCDQDLCLNLWYNLKKLLWQDEHNPRVRYAFGNVSSGGHFHAIKLTRKALAKDKNKTGRGKSTLFLWESAAWTENPTINEGLRRALKGGQEQKTVAGQCLLTRNYKHPSLFKLTTDRERAVRTQRRGKCKDWSEYLEKFAVMYPTTCLQAESAKLESFLLSVLVALDFNRHKK